MNNKPLTHCRTCLREIAEGRLYCNEHGTTTTDGKPLDQNRDPSGQHGNYVVLNDEERAAGFVRPVRATYRHVGIRPKYSTRPLTAQELVDHRGANYVAFEEYPRDGSHGSAIGRFWTDRELHSGCGFVTSMGRKLAETYARDPRFYGATYCQHCCEHFPVGARGEFVWEGTDERVGT